MSFNSSKQPANRIIIYLALAALLGLGLWLRLRFIHTVRLYPDEFVTLLAVQMIGEKGAPVMPSGLFYEHGLLFSYFGSLAALFGPARLAVRYASLFFGLLTVGFTFFVGRRWFSPAVGFIAATGLVVAPAAIHWSGRARMYALLQLLVLLTLWLAYEGVIHRRARWRWLALLTYLGATLTQFLSVVLAPPLVLAGGVIWLRRQPNFNDSLDRLKFALLSKRRWRIWLEAAALLLILAIAFWLKRIGQPKGIEAFEPANALSGLAQVFVIYSNFSLNLAEGWQAIAPFYLTLPALIFVPFASVAMVTSWKTLGPVGIGKDSPHSPPVPQLPDSPALFLTFILITTTLEMILFVSPDRRDDKYLFILLPVLFLLGAQGMAIGGHYLLAISLRGSRLISRIPRIPRRAQGAQVHHAAGGTQASRITPEARRQGRASERASVTHHASLITNLLSPLLVSGLILTITRPAVHALLSNLGDDYDAAFAYVQDHWQPGDTILTGTPPAAAFYLGRNDFYSVQRRGGYDYRILTIAGQPVDRWLGSPVVRTETALHQTLANHNVWLVLERWGLQSEYYDLPFQQQLLAQTDYVAETQGIFILHSKADPQPIALNPTHPVEAVFGSQVRLTGYTVEPEQPAPGRAVRLTLYWQALAPLSHDYTVFVHLRKPEGGGNVAQADHRPLGNVYPTTLWPVGETIRETNDDLLLPPDLPPGNYDLWVGLYLLQTGERLTVQNDTSGENAVRLGVLTVESRN